MQIAEHLEPKLHTLIAALAGSDSQQVHIASVSLSEETKKVKKELLGRPKIRQFYGSYTGFIWHFYKYIYKYGNLLQSYGQWQSLDDKHDDVPNEAWWFSMAMLNYEGIGVYRIHICIQCVCIYIYTYLWDYSGLYDIFKWAFRTYPSSRLENSSIKHSD